MFSGSRRSRIRWSSVLASVTLVSHWQLFTVVADPTGTQCSPPEGRSDTCVCQTSDGVVDLTSFSNEDGETAWFTNIGPDPNQFMYSYNPCNSFYSDICNDQVYSCQESPDGTQGFAIADDGTEQMWIDDDGTVYLYYTGDEGRETRVNLHCDPDTKQLDISTDGDSAIPLSYVIDITGCDVCAGGCDGGGGKDPGGGGGGGGGNHKTGVQVGAAGIAVVSILIAGVISYFVAGALIMKLHYKATGADIIPNKNFWVALPFLLKDGCVFTFGPCVNLIRGKVSKKSKYDEIPP